MCHPHAVAETPQFVYIPGERHRNSIKLRNSRRTGTAEDTGDLDELSGLLGGIHLGVGLDDSEGLTGCVKMAFWGGWQKLKPFVKIDGFAACVGWVSVLG